MTSQETKEYLIWGMKICMKEIKLQKHCVKKLLRTEFKEKEMNDYRQELLEILTKYDDLHQQIIKRSEDRKRKKNIKIECNELILIAPKGVTKEVMNYLNGKPAKYLDVKGIIELIKTIKK